MGANLLRGLGQAQPVTQFIDTAMKVGAYQQDSTLRGMQTQREQIQLDELKKQQEHLDSVVDFRLTPFYLALPETARPQAEQMFKSLGAFDDNYRGTRRQMYQAVGEIEKNKEALKVLMQPVIDAKAQGVVKAFEAARKNPNDPKLAEAYQTAQMEHAAASGKLLDHIKALEAQDAVTFHNVPEGGTGVLINKRGKQVGTPIQGTPKSKMIPIFDPSSPTEYSYGNPGTGEVTDMAAPPPRSAAEKDNPFNSWKDAFIEANGRKPGPKEVMDWHRSGAMNVNIDNQSGKLDVKVAEGAIAKLPDLRKDASLAKSGVAKIEKMFTLLDAGAGGKMGQFRALVAPYAEALGVSSREMNDAKTYEVLARTIGGSMRMEIVGPGQVSNYENQLLQAVSGGGANGIAAARELLTFYRNEGMRKIGDYNDMVDSVSQFSPATGKLYKKIQATGVGSTTTPGAGRFQILKVE